MSGQLHTWSVVHTGLQETRPVCDLKYQKLSDKLGFCKLFADGLLCFSRRTGQHRLQEADTTSKLDMPQGMIHMRAIA